MLGKVRNKFADIDSSIERYNGLFYNSTIDILVIVGTIFTGLNFMLGPLKATVFGVIVICIGVFF